MNKEIPTNLTEILSTMKDVINCPVAWDFNDRSCGLEDPIQNLWQDICKKYEVDQESEWSNPDELCWSIYDKDDDIIILRSDLINILSWIDKAYCEFAKMVRPIVELKTASETEYSKHFPKPNVVIEKIASMTNDPHPALFFPRIRDGEIHELILDALEVIASSNYDQQYQELWESLLKGSKIRFAVDCLGDIGASKGKLVSHLAIEIEPSTPIAHAYPVSEFEAKSIMKKMAIPGIDNLQGYGTGEMGEFKITQRPYGKVLPLTQIIQSFRKY